MPLFTKKTFEKIIAHHQAENADCTVMTAFVDNPPAYGRIVRDANGKLADVIETKDCNEEQLKITELNIGVYFFRVYNLTY